MKLKIDCRERIQAVPGDFRVCESLETTIRYTISWRKWRVSGACFPIM